MTGNKLSECKYRFYFTMDPVTGEEAHNIKVWPPNGTIHIEKKVSMTKACC